MIIQIKLWIFSQLNLTHPWLKHKANLSFFLSFFFGDKLDKKVIFTVTSVCLGIGDMQTYLPSVQVVGL